MHGTAVNLHWQLLIFAMRGSALDANRVVNVSTAQPLFAAIKGGGGGATPAIPAKPATPPQIIACWTCPYYLNTCLREMAMEIPDS